MVLVENWLLQLKYSKHDKLWLRIFPQICKDNEKDATKLAQWQNVCWKLYQCPQIDQNVAKQCVVKKPLLGVRSLCATMFCPTLLRASLCACAHKMHVNHARRQRPLGSAGSTAIARYPACFSWLLGVELERETQSSLAFSKGCLFFNFLYSLDLVYSRFEFHVGHPN